MTADEPTPEQRAKHRYVRTRPGKAEGERGDRDSRSAWRRVCECPLSEYLHAGRITAEQEAAGIRFRAIWEAATIGGLGVPDLDRPIVQSAPRTEIPDRTVDAIASVNRACRVAGQRGSVLLIEVCGIGRHAGEVGRAQGWPEGYAMERLREALEALIEAGWPA